jgi:hypothetical protein
MAIKFSQIAWTYLRRKRVKTRIYRTTQLQQDADQADMGGFA